MKLPFLLLYLGSVFLASVSQVLLKMAAQDSHKNVIGEYLNMKVIAGYILFFMCTLLTMIAYRGIPMNLGPILETTGYIYIMIFGALFFGEKCNIKKAISLIVIICGIAIYSL